MKTKGFDIEAVRMADETPFENLTAATLIAAWKPACNFDPLTGEIGVQF
jgi:hypothetical protein